MPSAPKFAVHDRVRIARPGADHDLAGVVIEVDDKRVMPHYVVEFNHVHKQRFPEFHLARIPEAVEAG